MGLQMAHMSPEAVYKYVCIVCILLSFCVPKCILYINCVVCTVCAVYNVFLVYIQGIRSLVFLAHRLFF